MCRWTGARDQVLSRSLFLYVFTPSSFSLILSVSLISYSSFSSLFFFSFIRCPYVVSSLLFRRLGASISSFLSNIFHSPHNFLAFCFTPWLMPIYFALYFRLFAFFLVFSFFFSVFQIEEYARYGIWGLMKKRIKENRRNLFFSWLRSRDCVQKMNLDTENKI